MMRGGGEAGDRGRSTRSASPIWSGSCGAANRSSSLPSSWCFFLALCIARSRPAATKPLADLAINPEGSDALDMGDITASLGGGGLGFDQKLETQVRILKSDSLAWTVISALRLDKQPTFAGHRKFIFFGPL